MQPVVPTLHAIHGYTSAELNIRKDNEFKSLYFMMSPYTLVSGTKLFIVTSKDCRLPSLQFDLLVQRAVAPKQNFLGSLFPSNQKNLQGSYHIRHTSWAQIAI